MSKKKVTSVSKKSHREYLLGQKLNSSIKLLNKDVFNTLYEQSIVIVERLVEELPFNIANHVNHGVPDKIELSTCFTFPLYTKTVLVDKDPVTGWLIRSILENLVLDFVCIYTGFDNSGIVIKEAEGSSKKEEIELCVELELWVPTSK